MTNDILMKSILFQSFSGSRAYGLETESSDLDIVAVALEPSEAIYGLEKVDTYIHRPGRKDGDSSQPGDLDLTVYPLKKFVKMACQANPNIYRAFFAPKVDHDFRPISQDHLCGTAKTLLANFHWFLSMKMFETHIGFAVSEYKKIMSGKCYSSRLEIFEKCGYDSKAAYYALVMLRQLNEIASQGTFRIPFEDEIKDFYVSLREGDVSKAKFKDIFAEDLEEAKRLERKVYLPKEPYYDRVNVFLELTYRNEFQYT